MQDHSITLYIPGLFTPAVEAAQMAAFFKAMPLGELPELEMLLARAQQQRSSASDEQRLFSLFGIATQPGDWPVAAVTRLVDVGSDDGHYWLRADPVHMQPSRDEVVMFGNSGLNIGREEMEQLRDEFNRLCAADGLHLETPVNQRWYLRVEQPPQITTTPLHAVLGRDIHHSLPQGQDGVQWHKLLSEIQMLFYGSSVNQQRRQQNQPEINSLWFWGGGKLPIAATTAWQRLWSNEVVSRGLARLTQVPESSLPATGEEWLEQVSRTGRHLVVLDAIRQFSNQRDELIKWHEFVQELNQSWFVPLLAALRRGELSEITLITDTHRFDINRKQLRRWWRRRRSFSSYGQGCLAEK